MIKQSNPEQIRPKKKVVIGKRDLAAAKELEDAQADKEHTELAPREVIKTEEGALIQNYEVDFGPEEELVMAAGVRGIRALRIQREAIQEQIAVPDDGEAAAAHDVGADRFKLYGGKKVGDTMR